MTDPDLTEFKKLSERDQRRPCKVAAALDQIGDGDARAQLEAALAADTVEITSSAIVKWLAVRNIAVNSQSVAYHRREQCKCHAQS